MSWKKIHLLDSDEPITVGKDVTANCGKLIVQAAMAFENDWQEGECIYELDMPNVCDDCREEALEKKELRYTFGLMPGQESEIEGENE